MTMSPKSSSRSYSLNAIFSLAAGAIIYLLFRPPVLFFRWIKICGIFAKASFWGDVIVRYYLPDLLWSYALCFSLFRLHLPSMKKAFFLSLLSFLFGCFWEIMQYVDFVSGTGDIFDCVSYGVGALAALCI